MNFALTADGDLAAMATIRTGSDIKQKAEGRE
ncbi:hypothetical protein DSM107133_02352 [Pseudosulfitobacter sp. DSM 107133]|nr:hypothetical protein DSM107133_02352 [Pseudosulfitobacter sp. DSM 107133]